MKARVVSLAPPHTRQRRASLAPVQSLPTGEQVQRFMMRELMGPRPAY
jgi:hypothetical protein